MEFSRRLIENFIRQLDSLDDPPNDCEAAEKSEQDETKVAPKKSKAEYLFKLDGDCEDIYRANVEQVLIEQEKLKTFKFQGLLRALRKKNAASTQEEREYCEKLTAKLLER